LFGFSQHFFEIETAKLTGQPCSPFAPFGATYTADNAVVGNRHFDGATPQAVPRELDATLAAAFGGQRHGVVAQGKSPMRSR